MSSCDPQTAQFPLLKSWVSRSAQYEERFLPSMLEFLRLICFIPIYLLLLHGRLTNSIENCFCVDHNGQLNLADVLTIQDVGGVEHLVHNGPLLLFRVRKNHNLLRFGAAVTRLIAINIGPAEAVPRPSNRSSGGIGLVKLRQLASMHHYSKAAR